MATPAVRLPPGRMRFSAQATVTNDWAFRFLGIADVEHVYFYAATSATPELVRQYFEQAYQLGRDFERPIVAAAQSAPAA